MARPTKLTPEAQDVIVRAISAGGTRADASAAAGVSYVTFLAWLKRGERAKTGPYLEFLNAVTKAEADVRVALANAFASAGRNDWRAAESYLKRRDPGNWGDRLQVSKLSDDELLRLLDLAERGGVESRGRAAGLESSPASEATDE